ncbi:hypothetical protein OAF98_05490, partial [Planctomicrobium sp.]
LGATQPPVRNVGSNKFSTRRHGAETSSIQFQNYCRVLFSLSNHLIESWILEEAIFITNSKYQTSLTQL